MIVVSYLCLCLCMCFSAWSLKHCAEIQGSPLKGMSWKWQSQPIPSHAPTWSSTGKPINTGKRSLWEVEIKYRDLGRAIKLPGLLVFMRCRLMENMSPTEGLVLNSIRADLPNLWHLCFPIPNSTLSILILMIIFFCHLKHNAVRLQGFLTHPPVTSVIGKGVINGQLQQLTM